MGDANPIIELSHLEKRYGSRVVLAGVDLAVRRGEALVILGASGSGKSTLLRSMVGLEPPDGGRVSLLGVDLYRCSRRRNAELLKRIGVAFQGGALFGSMTVAENVELPLAELTRLPASTRRIVVGIKLALVGLEGAADRYPSELSGGMVKRAAFARAMALDPEILFFDEPSAGLDPITAAGLDRLIIELQEVFGVTMVVVTHELESAFAIADRIALMHRGRFVVVGSPEAVESSDDPVVRQFLDRRPEGVERKSRRLHELLAVSAVVAGGGDR